MTIEQRAEQIYRGNTIEEETYKNGWYDAVDKACDWLKDNARFVQVDGKWVFDIDGFRKAMEGNDE